MADAPDFQQLSVTIPNSEIALHSPDYTGQLPAANGGEVNLDIFAPAGYSGRVVAMDIEDLPANYPGATTGVYGFLLSVGLMRAYVARGSATYDTELLFEASTWVYANSIAEPAIGQNAASAVGAGYYNSTWPLTVSWIDDTDVAPAGVPANVQVVSIEGQGAVM